MPSGAVNIIKHKKTVILCSVLGKKRFKQKKVTFEQKCTAKVEDNLRGEGFLSRHENVICNERLNNSVYWRGPPSKYMYSAKYKYSEMKE